MSIKLMPRQELQKLPLYGRAQWPSYMDLRRDMEKMFDHFFHEFESGGLRAPNRWMAEFDPVVDVIDTDKNIKVIVDLPGLSEKDIEVNVSDMIMSIKGEKKEDAHEEGENQYLVERNCGSFYREILLPEAVDMNRSEAKFKNGVLEVLLPKKEEAKRKEKKIDIKRAA